MSRLDDIEHRWSHGHLNHEESQKDEGWLIAELRKSQARVRALEADLNEAAKEALLGREEDRKRITELEAAVAATSKALKYVLGDDWSRYREHASVLAPLRALAAGEAGR